MNIWRMLLRYIVHIQFSSRIQLFMYLACIVIHFITSLHNQDSDCQFLIAIHYVLNQQQLGFRRRPTHIP